jgi:glycosyltransferase involved in cell wall biosynthesis
MDMGHEVTLVIKEPLPGVDENDTFLLHAKSAKVPCDLSIEWDRRTKPGNLFSIPGILRDTRKLRALIDQKGADIVVSHSDHDHLVVGRAVRKLKRKPLIVRTDYKRNSIPKGVGHRFLMSRYTDGIVTFSKMGERTISEGFGFPTDKILVVNPALDLERWTPDFPAIDMRKRFGIPPDALVIGMVARFQKYRKTDVVISAFSALVKKFPHVKLLLLGRSSQMEESVFEPIRKKGLEGSIYTPGHIRRDYRDALKTMDIFVYTVPGSDGTARALREAMALGIPGVAVRMGMIPELVEHGTSGLLVEPHETAFETALSKLIEDRSLREALGVGAREKARRDFDIKNQAKEIEGFYLSLLLSRK